MKTLRTTRLVHALSLTVTAWLLVPFLGTTADAQPRSNERGSVLVFPLYDARDHASTVITVSNTGTSTTVCPNGVAEGDVALHYQYFDETFLEFDRFELLTPGDQLSVLVDDHGVGELRRGWLVVTALDAPPSANQYSAIDYDFLVGSALVVEADRDTAWAYRPHAFAAVGDPADACQRPLTDADVDGAVDFDGIEYEMFPAEIVVDSFFEEGRFRNSIALMSTTPFGTTIEVEARVRNNQGLETVSTAIVTGGFQVSALSDLAPAAGNLQGDSAELGAPGFELGWARLRGLRTFGPGGQPIEGAVPPILAVFRESLGMRAVTSTRTLTPVGTLDGLEVGVGNGL